VLAKSTFSPVNVIIVRLNQQHQVLTGLAGFLTNWLELILSDLYFMMFLVIQMRDLVNKKSFLVRKKLDNFLHWLLPTWWVPLYTSVTFSRMRYHKCVSNRAWQDSALGKISSLVGILGLACSVWFVSFSLPDIKLDPKQALSYLLTVPSLLQKEL